MDKKLARRQSKWRKRKQKLKVTNEEVWQDGRDDDIVIPIMGPTGVGKSTFINYALAKAAASVGHGLTSRTVNLQPIPLEVTVKGKRRRLVIVDTPGFDDTYTDDAVVLRRIAIWLANSYSERMTLGGVIYLHDITQPRMLGATRRNLEMFQKLCGNLALKAVVLGTTKWSDVEEAIGRRRELHLRENYWKEMIAHGSEMRRFEGTYESAWELVNIILEPQVERLRIQEELVDLEMMIPATEAGKQLRLTLEETLKMQRDLVAKEKARTQSGGGMVDPQVQQNYQELENLARQVDQLKGGLWQRIMQIMAGV